MTHYLISLEEDYADEFDYPIISLFDDNGKRVFKNIFQKAKDNGNENKHQEYGFGTNEWLDLSFSDINNMVDNAKIITQEEINVLKKFGILGMGIDILNQVNEYEDEFGEDDTEEDKFPNEEQKEHLKNLIEETQIILKDTDIFLIKEEISHIKSSQYAFSQSRGYVVEKQVKENLESIYKNRFNNIDRKEQFPFIQVLNEMANDFFTKGNYSKPVIDNFIKEYNMVLDNIKIY